MDTRGIITTVAGSGRAGFSGDGGPATRASLDEPWDVAISDHGTLYIADKNNSRIRAVAPNGVITTVAGGSSDAEFTGDGGPATSALLSLGYLHSGIALDSGGALYITEDFGRVRKIARNGIITTVAGDGTEGFTGDGGPGTAARLNAPVALAVTSDSTLFISDWGNQRVRMVVDRPSR